jgi:hypothetical protein
MVQHNLRGLFYIAKALVSLLSTVIVHSDYWYPLSGRSRVVDWNDTLCRRNVLRLHIINGATCLKHHKGRAHR